MDVTALNVRKLQLYQFILVKVREIARVCGVTQSKVSKTVKLCKETGTLSS